jgi:hypothetical protein
MGNADVLDTESAVETLQIIIAFFVVGRDEFRSS